MLSRRLESYVPDVSQACYLEVITDQLLLYVLHLDNVMFYWHAFTIIIFCTIELRTM